MLLKKTFSVFLLSFSLFQAQAQLPNTISAGDKVFGLSKFWQEVNYNFVYFDRVNKAKWDSTYKTLLTQVVATPNDYEYYRLLKKFSALLADGHTGIYYPENMVEMNTMFGDYRLFVENIDGKAIIVRTNLSKTKELPVGSEVIEVNGLPTAAYIQQYVAPYISTSAAHILKDQGISDLFKGMAGRSYEVKIKKPDGMIAALKLTHQTTAEKEVYPAYGAPSTDPFANLFKFEWKNKEVAYVALNSFSEPVIDSLFVAKLPELYKAKAIIIDLRANGGGNSKVAKEIFQYLTADSLIYGAKTRSRDHVAVYKAWGAFTAAKDTAKSDFAKQNLLTFEGKRYLNFDYAPSPILIKAARITVPIVLLTGHATASAAEDFLIYSDKQKHMYKIGNLTFGSTGQPLIFALPGAGEAWICTKQDTYPDGKEFVGYGIQPDLEVTYTLADYLAKKDPAVEKALDYLKKKLK